MRRSFLGMQDTLTAPKFLPISDIPLIFYRDKYSQAPHFNSCTDYPHFLNTLQEWVAPEGLDRADVGTHSLRRWLVSDWTLVGIPDRLRRAQGRLRSEIVADRYIDSDESINIQMHLTAYHHAASNHAERQQQQERIKKQHDRTILAVSHGETLNHEDELISKPMWKDIETEPPGGVIKPNLLTLCEG
jgi:hypothetical protein